MKDALLISLVAKHEELYNFNHSQYLSAQKRDGIWEEIGSIMKQEGIVCKERWARLRENYRKALILRKTRSVQRVHKKMKAPKHNKELKFLLPYLNDEDKLDLNVSESDTDEDYIVTFTSLEGDSARRPDADPLLTDIKYKMDSPDDTHSSGSNYAVNGTSMTINNSSNDGIGDTVQYLSPTDSMKTASSADSTAHSDPLIDFFVAMGKTVKTFPIEEQIKMKAKIFNVINDAEARLVVYTHQAGGPGSTKPASIPKSQLKYLSFVVQGNGRSRHKYTYWNARNIAKDPRIDFKRKTLLVATGYLDSPNLPISAMFANEYEDRGYNVILVDYQRFATVHYHLATRLMRPVGRHIAEVLIQLTEAGLDPAKLELLGFSLGGQTVSFIATHYQQTTNRNVSTIISLEPSGPCFRNLSPKERLDPSNADFVQVIHTNIDGYGMATPMGHVDFFVNGGEYQPSDINIYPCTTTCSHFRVLTLWLSALKNPKKFIGLKCSSIQQARDSDCYDNMPLITNLMGSDIDRTKQGIFYLATSKEYPYYLGAKGLKSKYVYWRTVTDINDGNETNIYT